MIEIIVLFLGIYGTLAVSDEPYTDHEFRIVGNEASDDTDVIEARIRGAANLNEKALPISRLFNVEPDSLPGNRNMNEKTQIRRVLPGTDNLAEKSIPGYIIRRLSNPSNRRVSSNPDFEEIPI